jgi:hypothetical protein
MTSDQIQILRSNSGSINCMDYIENGTILKYALGNRDSRYFYHTNGLGIRFDCTPVCSKMLMV